MVPLARPARLRALSSPVKRILAHSLLFGLSFSIADLLFNFYLVSMGYGTDTAGLMSTISRGAGMLLGVPMGMLIDRMGAQRSLVVALAIYCAGWLLMLQASLLWALAAAQFVIGAAFLMAMTAVIPLLSAVTNDDERARVFGFNASATLTVGLVGSAIGGLLPTAAALLLAVGNQTTAAYRLALGAVIVLALGAMLPVLRRFPVVSCSETQRNSEQHNEPATLLPLARLLRFALAGLMLGMGGGALLPFQNLFFRNVFGLSDSVVGMILAITALGMGMGALMGSPVTARIGLRRAAAILRMGTVVGLMLMLIPALMPAIVGFFLRGMFVSASFPMNDALIMRHTPARQRGMAMSLVSVLWAGGWAVSAVISGYVQMAWGFTPIIIFAAVAYTLSALAIITLKVDE
ncbi:MAG: MFS transporter [Candidatus Viridilinea halotolerans]|uniref:MFS transporter n=1 Tax=Candidatus Viridilinea halotolerans TaxID=2491704 RepID=A0A426TQG5_9CHLR|nr:MAG: MFS transporter [Candidatus Viridilinea halotolerans]